MKKLTEKLRQVIRYPLLCLFALFLLFIFCMDMTSTHKTYSEMENRPLTQKPEMTADALIHNEYTMDYEKYVNDQFIWRDGWITLKSVSESALQKIENNGVAFGKDHYLFEKYTAVNRKQLDKNLSYVQEFVDTYPELSVTLAVVPNSYAVLEDKVPAHFVNVPQEPLIQEMYDRLGGENLREISLIDPLKAHKDEYIYYRTDHHWTTLGAYYGYAEYVKSLDMEPVPMEEIAPLANTRDGFYGTYYSKAKLYNTVPDTLTWYDLPVQSVEIDGEQYGSMYDLSKLEVRDKYAAFLWGNHGLTRIVVNEVEDPTRVLVIKDSYGNSLTPFLTQNFDEVWVTDLRHVFGLSGVLQQAGEKSFDEVLILYNYMNFVKDTNLAKLRY